MIAGYLISFFLLFLQTGTPILERKIDITENRQNVEFILDEISRKAGFQLSYGDGILPESKVVSVSYNDYTVRKALTSLLGKDVEFREKGNYLILTRRKKNSKVMVTGYVSEKESSLPVKGATIYDRHSLSSTVSDQAGYYELEVAAKKARDLSVVVAKSDFTDKTIVIPAGDTIVDFFLEENLEASSDTNLKFHVAQLSDQMGSWFRKMGGFIHNKNVSDTLHSRFQFSLFPYVGTNKKMSGRVSNDYSLNLVGGYSESNNVLELGGAFNVNRQRMKGFQISGGANITGDSASGFQLTGGANIVGNNFRGVQVAGAVNINSKNAQGVQISSLANVVRDTMQGVQITGGANVSAVTISGMQISGGLNHAETVKGVQLSGGLNHAQTVYGVQIAPINICDTIRGLPIGFLSFVKSGIHDFEVSADETFYTNFAFRTGVVPFNNIILLGADPGSYERLIWYMGYGLGTGVRINRKWVFETDFTARHINRDFFYNEISEMGRINLGFEFRPGKKFAVSTSVTLNTYVTDSRNSEFDGRFNSIAPYVHYSYRFKDGIDLKSWVGGKVAVRLF